MTERRGDTLLFHTPPVIAAQAAVGGKKESDGPLAAGFDELTTDNRLGQRSWEAAEKQLQLRAARLCLQKASLPAERVDLALAGDLQAQCTASGYALRELGVPFAGLFGACSTMAEALALGAALCSSGAAQNLLAMTSSHFCAAERQFRTPLSYGAVRTPTAQWTATAAGCCLLRPAGQGVGIAAATLGRVQDYDIKDINNMGAAMAPAAAATLLHYLADTHAELRDFDCIYTGDLGLVGSQMLRELLAAEGLLLKNHADCRGTAGKKRRFGRGLLRRRALRAYPAKASAPRQPPGAVYRHRGTDEPDHLFAEGEHPGGGTSGRADRAGKGELK